MKSISIEPSVKTPGISADPEKGTVRIWGRSHPENTAQTYWPLIDWTDKYIRNPKDQTVISIELEYFNTSSSKVILNILKKFEAIPDARQCVTVRWHYEADEEDDLETGETLAQMTGLNFEFIGI